MYRPFTVRKEPHTAPKRSGAATGPCRKEEGGALMASPEKFVDLPVPRRPLRALYCTWEAVHDGTPLDAFLRYRLRVYEAKYRKSFHPLPFDIAIVGGAIVCVPNPEYKGYWEELQDEGGEGGVQ